MDCDRDLYRELGGIVTDLQTEPVARPAARTNNKTQHQGNTKARQLLSAWLADESGYDEATWPGLKQNLEANRYGHRKLFSA